MTARTMATCLLAAVILAGCAPGAAVAPGSAGSGRVAERPTASEAATSRPTPTRGAVTTSLPSPPVTPAATPSAQATPGRTPTDAPGRTPGPTPASTASVAPPVAFKPGDIAVVTATEGIRMRTEPSVGADSARYAPMLPAGTDLYVLSGPTHGSGYHWYEVSPVTFRVDRLVEWPATIIGSGQIGWVPAASRDGQPWLDHGTADCPPAPDDVMALERLSVGARRACFSKVPITVEARLLPCNCDVDPGLVIRPAWFAPVTSSLDEQQGEALGGGELVLVPPETPARRLIDWPTGLDFLWLRLGPDFTRRDRLPVGDVVTVTGMFDAPGAERCEVVEPDTDGSYQPTEMCHAWFVVTSIR